MIRFVLFFALLAVLWRVARSLLPVPHPPGRPRAPDTAPRDPWAVLGIAPGATRAEIGAAYRDQIKRYHPDRVADLGPELQRVAHEKTVEIQRAYDELTR